jgi:integrase/recombinase XerD
MYEHFKDQFITNMSQMKLNLNQEQVNKILTSMDNAAYHYDIYDKDTSRNFKQINGIPQIVYTYLSCKQTEGRTKETLYGYQVMLEIFFHTVKKDPKDVEANDIRCFLYNYQQVHHISNRTLDKYREYLLRFFTWCHESGEIPRNPASQCKPIHYEMPERCSLTAYELEKLRMACWSAKERAIIETLYSTACRVSELTKIKLSDVDWYSGTVRILGKGSKHRLSFLNARAKIALEEYLRVRNGESEYLICSDRKPYGPITKEAIEKIVRTIAGRVEGLNKHVTPHVLRHTTATLALHNGMTINEISTLLGHSNIETTMIYAKTSYDSVRQAHDRYVV